MQSKFHALTNRAIIIHVIDHKLLSSMLDWSYPLIALCVLYTNQLGLAIPTEYSQRKVRIS